MENQVGKIYVIADDGMMESMLCRAMGDMPTEVGSESSILKAIADVSDVSPDIIMLNIEQAGSNAADVVRALNTAAADAWVIGYGHAWTECYHAALSGAGMDDILILPATVKQLRKMLAACGDSSAAIGSGSGNSLNGSSSGSYGKSGIGNAGGRNTLSVDDAAEMAGYFSNMVRGRFMNVCRELAAAIPAGIDHLRMISEERLTDFLEARRIVIEEPLAADSEECAGTSGASAEAKLLSANGQNYGVLKAWADQTPIDVDTLEAIAEYLVVLFELAERDRDLKSLATVDELTGAFNRRYLESYMRQLLARAESEDIKIAMLVFDIDNFKYYNDTYGHIAGDHILCQATELVRQCCRKHDVVARLGGDEFAVLFWDAPELQREVKPEHEGEDSEMPGHDEMVLRISNNFRKLVSECSCASRYGSHVSKLTISGGIASFPKDGDTVKMLLAAADEALLKSKEAGKNQIKQA